MVQYAARQQLVECITDGAEAKFGGVDEDLATYQLHPWSTVTKAGLSLAASGLVGPARSRIPAS